MASPKALAAIALTLIIAAPICLGFAMASENTTYTEWQTESNVNLSDTILNSEYPIYMPYDGVSNNNTLTNGTIDYRQTSSTPTAYPMQTITTHQTTFNANEWVDLSAYPYWEIRDNIGVTYYKNGDMTHSYSLGWTSGQWVISGNGGTIRFTNTHTFDVLSYSDDGDYADINAGWKLPTATSWYTWTNNQVNETVTILLDLYTNSSTWLQGDIVGVYRTNDGLVYVAENRVQPPHNHVQTITLGYYQYVLAERNPQGWTFSGLTAWPNMGSSYQTFNTIDLVFQENTQTATFQTLAIKSNNIGVYWRVESATILSGSFPSTEDYTLNMDNLFPDKSYSLKLNSIGIYGDTLTIGTHAYTVANGRISIDGDSVALKGANIASRWNGSSYDLYVASHKIGTSSDPASITFGGEWSLTVTAQILKQVTGEKAEWAPGSFAFDEDSFKGVIVLAAALTFIGVGMYGARSGVKVGLLLMICGGAALIAMITL